MLKQLLEESGKKKIEEIENLRKKNTLLKEQLKEIKGYPEIIDKEDICSLRREIKKVRVVEEILMLRMNEMEDENNYLRKELVRDNEKLATK